MQEQLALARQDMANELEQQIQVRRVCGADLDDVCTRLHTASLRSALSWAIIAICALISLAACNPSVIHLCNFPCPRIIFVLCSSSCVVYVHAARRKKPSENFVNLPKKKIKIYLNGRN